MSLSHQGDLQPSASRITCVIGSPSTELQHRCAMAMANVVPAVIIGGGRLGSALLSMGDGRDILVKRGENVPLVFHGPFFVCTRNDNLDAVLQSTPHSRWKDLVFFQNGMLEPWFRVKGLKDASQVLTYFAVSKLGEPPIDGKTDTDPEGLTVACGRWAEAVAGRLHAGGLSCKVCGREIFEKKMMEKLIWLSAFMLVGTRHYGTTVGIVETEFHGEAVALITELALAAEAEEGMKFDGGIVERLCAYSRAVGHFPTAMKEFNWRNGWFYSLSLKACAEGRSDPCPTHTAWLKEIKFI